MSSSHTSTASLLRRPRPPAPTSSLPPIPRQKSPEMNQPRRATTIPVTVPLSSIASHQDDVQPPAPTIQSEFSPVFPPSVLKPLRGQSQDGVSDNATAAGEMGDGLSKNGLVLPFKPRGPDPFPTREPKRPDAKKIGLAPIKCSKLLPEFTLEDFLLKSRSYAPQKSTLRKSILSKANYKKLTMILERELTQVNQDSVKTVDVAEQAEVITRQKRVPRRQLVVEMKQIVHDRLRELGVTSPTRLDVHKREVDQLFEEMQDIGDAEGVGRRSQLLLFTKAASMAFQTNRRFGLDGEAAGSVISPSELSILRCLMEGGYVLNLKAYFIQRIPDLSPLSATLVYMNLSFNEFSEFPREVLSCRELQVLKLRNNPLNEVPYEISKLRKLRTLIISFCCLTALPLSLFSLAELEFFDVSYNKLTFLPNEVKKLELLRILNVEGNELPGLPCGLLRLNLFRIRVRNNFTNPVFWDENSRNDPQRLTDLCLLQLKLKVTSKDPAKLKRLTPDVTQALSCSKCCDCCCGPRFGPGLKIIRPCTEIWGMKRIPFIFHACSPSCYSAFKHNIDPEITGIIYGTSDEKETSVEGEFDHC